ncbi:MAG: hypothetical protein ACQESC_00305 [Nanobdellota archaeon]
MSCEGIRLKIHVLVGVAFLLVVLFSSSAYSLSFDVEPITSPDNVTVNTDFSCVFTPNETATANITWFVSRLDDSIEQWTADDNSSIAVNSGVETTITTRSASDNTTKGELWWCQVTLYNSTDSMILNSSTNVSIVNSLPEISHPEQSAVISHSEDVPYSDSATATDADADDIFWTYAYSGHDPISTDFDISPFDFNINSGSGLMTFEVTNESQAGNHTVDIIAKDGSGDGHVRTVIFEIIPVNDSPYFDLSMVNCTEGEWCNGTLPVLDEEDDALTFSTNSTLINLLSNGSYSFIPEREHVGLLDVEVNVSDGVVGNNISETFTFNITSVNQPPNLSLESMTSLNQNESSQPFIAIFNASDIDYNDTLEFSISPVCGEDHWNISKFVDLNESTPAKAIINVSFFDDTTWLSSTTHTNDFVRCREVVVSVSDALASDSVLLNLSVNNTNDDPIIHEQSYASVNGVQTNISDLTTPQGFSFEYKVNATDLDMYTYQGDSLQFSISGSNASLFSINDSTGLISSESTLDSSGLLSFNVTASDLYGASATKTISIDVVESNVPVIHSFPPVECSEDSICELYINATDEDVENLTFIVNEMSFISPDSTVSQSAQGIANVSSLFNMSFNFSSYNDSVPVNGSRTIYLLNFTPKNSQVGNYSWNVSFVDSLGLKDTQEVLFSVNNTPDTPILNTSDFESSVIVENISFSTSISIQDDDLLYGLDNISFNMSLTSNNITAYSFNKTAPDRSEFSFLPNSSHIGVHTINISINDSTSRTDSREFSFEVFEKSMPPQITSIYPTNDSFSFSSPQPGNKSNVSFSENASLEFDVEAEDPDDDNMTLSWYYDGVKNSSCSYNGNGSCPLNIFFNFADAGIHTVTAVVEDEYYANATYEWIVDINDTNRIPLFLNDIQDYSFDNGRSLSGFSRVYDFFRLSSSNMVFIDPDDDLNQNNLLDEDENNTLSFSTSSVTGSTSCDDYIEFSFDGVDVGLNPTSVGTCYAQFIATDPYGESVGSNVVRFDITDVDEESSSSSSTTSTSSGTTTVRETITIPLEEEVDVPETFDIMTAGTTSIYENGSVSIPIVVENSWNEDLGSISFSANTSLDENINFTFSEDYIQSLSQDQTSNITLFMSSYRFEGPFEVNISATVESLDGFVDTETVYMNALEKAGEDMDSVNSRIGFTRDLLSDNPECQELTEFLDSAENMSSSDPRKSLEMVDTITQACKYMINPQTEKPSTEMPKSFLGRVKTFGGSLFDFSRLGVTLLIASIVAVIIGVFSIFTLKRI